MLKIEEALPAHLLLMQGQMVQTMAHVERAFWVILMRWERIDPMDADDTHRAMRWRKSNKASSGLSPALDKALAAGLSEACPDLRACKLLWEEELTLARHMAVHGAWYMDRDTGQLRCEHFENLAEKGRAPEWKGYADPIPVAEITMRLDQADGLLRRLLREDERLRQWQAET